MVFSRKDVTGTCSGIAGLETNGTSREILTEVKILKSLGLSLKENDP